MLSIGDGESVGQVASQTLPAMVCTDAVAGLPSCVLYAGWTRRRLWKSPVKLGHLTFPFSPMRTVVRYLLPNIPRPGRGFLIWRRRKQKLPLDQLVEEAVEGVREIVIEARG